MSQDRGAASGSRDGAVRDSELEARATLAESAARAAGAVLRRHFRSRAFEVSAKAEHDFVTSADRAAESSILEAVRGAFPEDEILSEESGFVPGGTPGGWRWIVDPLDGTTNFLQGLPVYAVSIACQRDGRTVVAAVYDPELDRLYRAVSGRGADRDGTALAVSQRAGLDGAFLATGFPFKARGALGAYLEVFEAVFLRARAVRRCGAAALDLAHTAAGVFDGFFEYRLSAWDVAAGELLIREAGGVVTDLDGGDGFLRGGNVLAGAPGVHGDLLRVARKIAGEAKIDRLVP